MRATACTGRSSDGCLSASPRPRSPEGAVGLVLNSLGRFGQLVGDGPGVAGHGGRGGVDLVDEQGQGAGDAGGAGPLELDGDGLRGAGGGPGPAAGGGLGGGGAGFFVGARGGGSGGGPPP